MQYRTLIKRVLHKSVDAKPRPQYDYGRLRYTFSKTVKS